ncbi:hypothetical protein D3C75_1259550 [compost metagenome]
MLAARLVMEMAGRLSTSYPPTAGLHPSPLAGEGLGMRGISSPCRETGKKRGAIMALLFAIVCEPGLAARLSD